MESDKTLLLLLLYLKVQVLSQSIIRDGSFQHNQMSPVPRPFQSFINSRWTGSANTNTEYYILRPYYKNRNWQIWYDQSAMQQTQAGYLTSTCLQIHQKFNILNAGHYQIKFKASYQYTMEMVNNELIGNHPTSNTQLRLKFYNGLRWQFIELPHIGDLFFYDEIVEYKERKQFKIEFSLDYNVRVLDSWHVNQSRNPYIYTLPGVCFSDVSIVSHARDQLSESLNSLHIRSVTKHQAQSASGDVSLHAGHSNAVSGGRRHLNGHHREKYHPYH